MPLREEELYLLFKTIDAMINEKMQSHNVRAQDFILSSNKATILKQKCINLICFGEAPEEE